MPSQRSDWDDFVHSPSAEEFLSDSASSYNNVPRPITTPTGRCFICGCCLSIEEPVEGDRCLDPAHWRASGVLSATDYTFMARIEARARAEKRKRS